MEPKTTKKRSVISWLWEFSGRRKAEYLASVLMAVAGVICSLIPYYIMIGIIKGLVNGTEKFSWYMGKCMVMGVFWIIRYIFHSISTILSHHATFQVLANIRIRLLKKLSTIMFL